MHPLSLYPASDLLVDSEASLRLVDRALTELCLSEAGAATRSSPGVPGLTGASLSAPDGPDGLLRHAQAELSRALEDLRDSRRSLQQTAIQMLQHTTGGLRGVAASGGGTSADRRDGLMRTVALAKVLETSRLDRTSGVLAQTEHRLLELIRLLEPERLDRSPDAEARAFEVGGELLHGAEVANP